MANGSDTPDEQSIAEFIKTLCQHDKVASVNRDSGELTVEISILGSSAILRVYMTNIYCVGEADVREFLDVHPSLSAIVTLSSWNQVSTDASAYGRDRKKGVFTWKQFFGALNYKKYWLYEDLPYGIDSKRLAAERKRRRTAWN